MFLICATTVSTGINAGQEAGDNAVVAIPLIKCDVLAKMTVYTVTKFHTPGTKYPYRNLPNCEWHSTVQRAHIPLELPEDPAEKSPKPYAKLSPAGKLLTFYVKEENYIDLDPGRSRRLGTIYIITCTETFTEEERTSCITALESGHKAQEEAKSNPSQQQQSNK